MTNELVELPSPSHKGAQVVGFVCGVLSAIAVVAAGAVVAKSSSDADLFRRVPIGLLTGPFMWWVFFGSKEGKLARLNLPVGFLLCLLLGIALANG